MKKIIVLTVMIFINGISHSQEFSKPNYDQIEKATSSKVSPYFYDKLFSRYLAGDSTFTLEEKRHLYFGYQFTKKYSPYSSAGRQILDTLRQLRNIKNKTDEQRKTIIRLCDSALVKDPFDLEMINAQYAYYEALKNTEKCEEKKWKFLAIIDAILSSGDGKSIETAWYVLAVGHEYDVLHYLDLSFGGEQKLIDETDYLKISDNSQGITGVYFNVSASLGKMKSLFKD